MHGIAASILISLVNNVDNIGVRIAYSIRGIHMSWRKNLWISVITFIISTGAAFLGGSVLNVINPEICRFISMALLCIIGITFVISPFLKHKKKSGGKKLLGILADPQESDIDNSKDIDFREATFLGISLSINNMGGSFSGGMIGLNAVLIGVLSAVISFLTLWAGNHLTNLFIKLNLGKKATIAAGIILILIGIRQVFS